MDTVQINVVAPVHVQDILIAELASSPVAGFEQTTDDLRVFISEDAWTPKLERLVWQTIERRVPRSSCTVSIVPAQNWNQIWEQSIEPLSVPPFYVRPSWAARRESDTNHSGAADEYTGTTEIVIDPKMSFGTGHHESTRLALRHLASTDTVAKNVLDVGTGTGILAIAAAKLGASHVIGIDFDEWATSNARENVLQNRVDSQVEIRGGEIRAVDEGNFDLILANINRNVLLSDMSEYNARLATGGVLVLSGLQLLDADRIVEAANAVGLVLSREISESDWWSASVNRNTTTV